MKLTYIYVSVPELAPALAFYRDELGLDEAWREGESTVAFGLPGSPVQLMLDVPPDGGERWNSGPFYEVDDVETFMKEHAGFRWVGDPIDLPGGRSVSFADPAGNVIHVFDQSAADTE
ncbi:VOC family protein [Jiangella asiatica]|uniref:VOC family protein n=1 Tax=Jiangella asiatica TaxID=2530372 RepID=A0A4R5DNF5_9ACTN|nr:VOC family protein [Jiangella asiatica]TDE15739.1 VOC family protein [Jiangella asiatica]